jgi:hypothetical protein
VALAWRKIIMRNYILSKVLHRILKDYFWQLCSDKFLLPSILYLISIGKNINSVKQYTFI